MSAHALHLVEPQEERKELEQQLSQAVRECTEVRIVPRNHVKRFLMKYDIWQLSDMDYPLRRMFEEYLKRKEISASISSCLYAFDQMKLHTMREEMNTISGRKKYELKYADKVLFLPYYPRLDFAEQFMRATDKSNLVWDFTKPCARKLKEQIFECLSYVVESYEPKQRKRKLTALLFLYEHCAQMGIADLELMTLEEEKRFREDLVKKISVKQLDGIYRIVELCRKILFIQADQIHWYAQVWFLERFHFSRERVNPSKTVESISFREITQEENKKYLKKYMRYALGITDISICNIQMRFFKIRNFLQAFNGEEKNICEIQEEKIHLYLEDLRKEDVVEATFNGRLFSIWHFFRFLLVKGYIRRIPFQYELYQKKQNPVHYDRSIREEICEEILSKLYRFPEHLRLMFLHLWCAGLRCSEVCILEGDAYEWKNNDAWVKVYQVKMKTYKRIPIPETLYKLMNIYIAKYQIQPGEYLFKNQKGGAYLYGTFRNQMLELCRKNQIAGGEYVFRSHDYRHAVATEYYESGVSIQAVRDYLGHDYEDMTRQYIDYMPRRLDAANEEFFSQQEESLAAGLKKGDGDGE